MEWFEGNVTEALNEYQQKNGIMVVYIHTENGDKNENENSRKFDELWNLFDAIKTIQVPYVAIRLPKGSEGAQQFAEFFPTLTIPICYILGRNAQPLEVCTALQDLTLEFLNESFAKAIRLYKEQLKEEGISVDQIKTEEKPADDSTPAIENVDAENTMETVVETTTTDSTPANENVDAENTMATVVETTTTSTAEAEKAKEEKLQHYRKLLEEKKKTSSQKEEVDEREKEIRRRNEGKALAEFREKQRENELREATEARRKQKEADALALKKLRDQIKADKEERAKRKGGGDIAAASAVQEPSKTDDAVAAAASEGINKPIKTDECKIQCRFPNGSTLSLTLPSKEPLQVVFDAVNQDERKPNNFFLVQTYPRRKLTEMSKSLLDHGLTPSSVILVISADAEKKGQSSLVPSTGYLAMLFGLIYLPFIAFYQFFTSLTGGQGGKVTPATSSGQSQAKETANSERSQNNNNIRRFEEDGSDHSDTEATWNGNSTQQL